MKKQFLFLLYFIIPCLVFSQNFEANWTGYFSYISIKAFSQGNDKIYVASENAVFTYDLSTQEIKTINTINGLSGEEISSLYYSETYGLLIIGRTNGLIEIVADGEENVLKVVDILDKPTIPPNRKRINKFSEYNENLYIATPFGIAVYNLALLEFGDTYIIGDLGTQIEIVQTAILEPYIYAATANDGIRRALVANDNIIDYEQWEQVANGFYTNIENLAGEIYTVNLSNQVLKFNQPFDVDFVATYTSPVVDFIEKNNVLTVTTQNSIQAFGPNFVPLATVNSVVDFNLDLRAGFAFNNTFYLGTFEDGVLSVPFGNTIATQLLPDGPIRNDPFSIDASPGQLWVNFGEVDVFYNPFFPNGVLSRRGISNLREGAWTNISYEDLTTAVNNEVTDLVSVRINPTNAEEVYMTSFHNGLLKIEGQEPSVLFNEENSPLDITGGNPDFGIRIFGIAFDQQNNIWMTQTRDEMGLIKVSPTGQFQKIDITSVIPPSQLQPLSAVAISREGFVFFGSQSSGVIAYNPSGGAFNKLGGTIGTGNLPNLNVRALTFDAQNRLWIGTLSGLRVLFSPSSVFEEDANFDAQPIIILEDGVAQELLFEQTITSIVVDGSNNKWISTATAGVFYISANGQETLLRFTKENSPLPSNNVQSVAIDSFTGTVYFATTNGLVAYNGSATAPREDLESVYVFPNPVRPGFAGNVTIDGLTAKANVKITDIEGNLVFEQTSQGGSVLWDTTAFGKYKVASGVYLVLITTEDAIETKVSKVMIVR